MQKTLGFVRLALAHTFVFCYCLTSYFVLTVYNTLTKRRILSPVRKMVKCRKIRGVISLHELRFDRDTLSMVCFKSNYMISNCLAALTFSSLAQQINAGKCRLSLGVSRSRTQTRHSRQESSGQRNGPSHTPLPGKDNTRKRQTSMPGRNSNPQLQQAIGPETSPCTVAILICNSIFFYLTRCLKYGSLLH
jgi:hypothetical protein